MQLPSIEEMLQAGMHFGHRTSKWHPKMAPFIFGSRGGVHVIDLEKSRTYLETALNRIKTLSAEGKVILFVGTKEQVKGKIFELAQSINMPSVNERWLGGTLTNFATIRLLAKKYKDLKEKKADGRLERYTKKERLGMEKEIENLDRRVGGLADMVKMPDAVFIWDTKHEKTALQEALKKGIEIIATCDTNTNPTGIKYVIPANDDATKTIELVLNLVREAAEEGKKEAADNKLKK